MNKYGEIARFSSNSFLYIIEIVKITPFLIPNHLFIPFFCVSISAKTAKKVKERTFDKDHLHFQLLNQGFASVSTMRKCEQAIQDYLDAIKPEYVAFSAFRDDRWVFEKRIKFYTRRLQSMGYELDHVDEVNWLDPTYFMRRVV